MNKSLRTLGLLGLLLALAACAAGSEASRHAAASGALAQFFLGLWHGVIAPVSLVIEVVDTLAPHALPWTMKLYERAEPSVIYDVGFYLGLMGSPSLAWRGWSRRGGD